MKLFILFIGLIAHFRIQNGALERAVLVMEASHQPRMEIRVSDLKNRDQVALFDHGAFFKDTDGVEWARWDLTDTHLEFHGLPAGPTQVDQRIPSLMAITNGKKEIAKVLSATKHAHTLAYVDYTGGQLVVLNSCPVKFTSPQPVTPNCNPAASGTIGTAASEVEYSGDTISANPPYITNGTEQLDLQPSAQVRISNTPRSAHFGPDHKEYLWLLDDGVCICEMSRCLRSAPKDPGALELHEINNAECTNSRFP